MVQSFTAAAGVTAGSAMIGDWSTWRVAVLTGSTAALASLGAEIMSLVRRRREYVESELARIGLP